MTRNTKAFLIGGGLLVVGIAVFGFNFLVQAGHFRSLQPHFAGTCTPLALAAPAEDIRIDPFRGIAYLTQLDERAGARGTVVLLDLNVPEPRPRAALASLPPEFHPLGIGLYLPGPQGARRLFAVNRLRNGDISVEIFEENATGAFAPVESVRHPALAHANAIAPIGEREFYVTTDVRGTSAAARLRSFAFGAGASTVTYFDGEAFRVVADGLGSASGIAISNHRLWVYVTEATGNRLQIFDRDSATGELVPRNVVSFAASPDNVTLDGDGTVWIAGHPKMLDLAEHVEDRAARSPTAVYRLRTSVIEKEDRLSIPYLELGENLSAGSVAAVHGGRMLVGSRTQPKVLICTLPARL